MHAFSRNLYDVIICNTLESFPAIYALNLHKSVQIIYYTHNESMVFLDDRTWKNEFTESFNEVFNALMHVKGITIGTQTERNLVELNHNGILNSAHLPILMTEKSLLQENLNTREGVLWIGRWEPRKNPEAFIQVIKETNLPAKVITNANGAKKFEAALKEIGATYEIKVGVYGQEKVDFLTSARVAFNPAIRESFGLAFYECIGHMPTVAIEGMSWLENFPKGSYYAAPKKHVAELIKKLYEDNDNPYTWYNRGSLDYIIDMDNRGIENWLKCFDSFTPSQSNSERAQINEHHTICYKDFLTSLERKFISIDDVKSVLTNKSKFNIIYTDTNTYLSKDSNFIPTEKQNNTLESLFG
jgi:glycosyltransferase involved in cell wall biosynthesis